MGDLVIIGNSETFKLWLSLYGSYVQGVQTGVWNIKQFPIPGRIVTPKKKVRDSMQSLFDFKSLSSAITSANKVAGIALKWITGLR